MKSKIEQTKNAIVSKIEDGNKKSTLIQKIGEDKRTHFIQEIKKQESNVTVTERVEYIF